MKTESLSPAELAGMIDHTLLDRAASEADLARVCDEAVRFGFKAVCVYPEHVPFVAERLAGRGVVVCAVAGFPSGLDVTEVKVRETQYALGAGAREIDMVVNPLALKTGDYQGVIQDIGGVVGAAIPWPVKVILETAALTRDQKVVAAALAKAAGAAFVKTSTGFGPGGATEEDVRLLRSVVGGDMGVKASGGIKTRADALAMIAAGASRIGASNSAIIVSGAPSAAPGDGGDTPPPAA